MPYYIWQCLTIELKDRDVDLIIMNDRDMIAIISLLIWKINTINGVAGTSHELTDFMSLDRKQELFSSVLMKYKILKARMKISFSAFQRDITIKELFYRQIVNTFQVFYAKDLIPMSLLDIYQQQESVFEEVLSLKTIDCIYYIMAMI